MDHTRPPLTGDERTLLIGWLDLQRDIVRWKCEGLSEEDAHRAVLPDSPLMTMAGLVSHLRWVEHCWFEVLFLNQGEADNPQFGDVDDAEFQVEGVPISQLLEEYAAQCKRSNEIAAAHSFDDVGSHPAFKAGGASLRWMLLHMLEETGRHAGHADIIRELLDGRKGYY